MEGEPADGHIWIRYTVQNRFLARARLLGRRNSELRPKGTTAGKGFANWRGSVETYPAELQRKHSAAIDAGDLLTVFYSNLHFHQMLFGLCSNTCLIEAIELLAQKTYGIRSYANAFPEALHLPGCSLDFVCAY